jgi:hypothetical protein
VRDARARPGLPSSSLLYRGVVTEELCAAKVPPTGLQRGGGHAPSIHWNMAAEETKPTSHTTTVTTIVHSMGLFLRRRVQTGQRARADAAQVYDQRGAGTPVHTCARLARCALLHGRCEVWRMASRAKRWHDAGVHNPAFDSRKPVLEYHRINWIIVYYMGVATCILTIPLHHKARHGFVYIYAE